MAKFNPHMLEKIKHIQEYLKKNRFKSLREIIKGMRKAHKKLAGHNVDLNVNDDKLNM